MLATPKSLQPIYYTRRTTLDVLKGRVSCNPLRGLTTGVDSNVRYADRNNRGPNAKS